MLEYLLLLALSTGTFGVDALKISAFSSSLSSGGYKLQYADHGSGAELSLSVWRPNLTNFCGGPEKNWRTIGDYAVSGYDAPTTNTLLVRMTEAEVLAVEAGKLAAPLARPTSMKMNWINKVNANTTHGTDGGLYTPVCPKNYVAMGSVALLSSSILKLHVTPKNFPDLMCVNEEYVLPNIYSNNTNISGLSLVWDSKPWKREKHKPHFEYDGSAWNQEELYADKVSLPFLAQGPHTFAAPSMSYTFNPAKVEIEVLPSACYHPQQVHLGYGYSPSVMGVQWSTLEDNPTNVTGTDCQWGIQSTKLTESATGQAYAFTVDSGRVWYNHICNMTGLKPAQKYYYRVGDAKHKVWSDTFKFTSQVEEGAQSEPQYHVVFGDMGAACAFTLCKACSCNAVCDKSTCGANTSVGLVSEVDKAAMFLQTGDFAYNLANGRGTVGDQFFRNIEQVAARVPYMVSVGNHENDPTSLAHYTERFRLMPSNSNNTNSTNGVAPNNWFFSWNVGLVHYIAISTELYFGVPWNQQTGVPSAKEQFEWLEADLKAHSKIRHKVPWVVVHGHRSLYCSCDGDCEGDAVVLRNGTYGLEELFMDYGVDFFLNGHEHNYERNWPTYKNKSVASNIEPKAPIYIVTGAAGCSELHEPFVLEQPARSAFRSNNFGYSRFIIHNASHARWQQVIMDPGNKHGTQSFFGSALPPEGTVIDDTWIVQSNHGPFNRSEAPSEVRECTPETCVTLDHWSDLLATSFRAHGMPVPEGHLKVNRSLISAFRKRFGMGTWLRTELDELALFEDRFGPAAKEDHKYMHREKVVWEDVSEDGSSDVQWEKFNFTGKVWFRDQGS